jgi:hypothetical protein
MNLRRDFGVVQIAGFDFHRRLHSRAGAEFTQFCFAWLSVFLPARYENQSAVSAVRAAAVAGREFP